MTTNRSTWGGSDEIKRMPQLHFCCCSSGDSSDPEIQKIYGIKKEEKKRTTPGMILGRLKAMAPDAAVAPPGN